MGRRWCPLKRILALLLLLSMLLSCAQADDILFLNPRNQEYVEMRENYLCLSADLDMPCNVQIQIYTADGQLVYARNYGECASPFTSENIFLKLAGTSSDYVVRFFQGDQETDCRIHRIQPMLYDNTACSAGIHLSALSQKDTWLSATILDIHAMPITVPLYAGNAYTLGTVTYFQQGSRLMARIETDPRADAVISSASLAVALTAVDARLLGNSAFHGPVAAPEQGVDTGDAPYAAVLLTMKVSFNPEFLEPASSSDLAGQIQLWEWMLQFTDTESNG